MKVTLGWVNKKFQGYFPKKPLSLDMNAVDEVKLSHTFVMIPSLRVVELVSYQNGRNLEVKLPSAPSLFFPLDPLALCHMLCGRGRTLLIIPLFKESARPRHAGIAGRAR